MWALGMAGYNCKVEYIEGKTNTCADLLSRHPENVGFEKDRLEDDVDLDVNDNIYQVNVLDSSNVDPRTYASCNLPEKDSIEKCDLSDFKDFDMSVEQSKDDELMSLKSKIDSGDFGKDKQKHYLVVENLLYYISNVEDDPYLRLYVPKHLRSLVTTQYHDKNGHMGVQKIFDSIRQKYYWPNLFKDLNNFVTACVVCQLDLCRR